MAPKQPPIKMPDSGLPPAPALPPEITHFDQMPDAAFVRLPVVRLLFACSTSAVWRNSKAGHIPRPRKISENISAWNVGELRQALANRAPI